MPMSTSSAHASTHGYSVPGDAETARRKPHAPRTEAPRDRSSVGAGAPTTLGGDLARTWLGWQCGMIAGVIRATLSPASIGGPDSTPLSVWPGPGDGMPLLESAAREALEKHAAITLGQQTYGPAGGRRCDLIAIPVLSDGTTVAVVSVMISPRSEPQQHAVAQLVQWGSLWLEQLLGGQADARREANAFALRLFGAVLEHRGAHVAALEIANRLAEYFGCARVGVGIRRGSRCRLLALSHQARFDPRTRLVRLIEAAMDEVLDQDILLTIPVPSSHAALPIHRAQRELAALQGEDAAVCGLPLHGESGGIGAITLERQAGRPFDDGELEKLRQIVALLGPLLALKLDEERPLRGRLARAAGGLLGSLVGPARLRLKLALLAAATGIGASALIDAEYHVSAPARIEGAVRQLLVAPADGYIHSASARAGDTVRKGQLIATLDDREPRLELEKWRGRRNQIDKEYQQALASRELGKLSVLRARMKQVDAEIHLVEDRLARTRLTAPLDGIVVQGDLSQSLGSPVEIGQKLFEIAPLDDYRVIVNIDERDIAALRAGDGGRLVFAAEPGREHAIRIDTIVPVAFTEDGQNRFRAEATLEDGDDSLRPGMRGVARIAAGERSLLWIWTHKLVDRLRLWTWSAGW